MNWKIIKKETTPVVLGIAMCINFILSFAIALWMGTALQKRGQSATFAVITGLIIFLVIGTILFWLSALIMDDDREEDALPIYEGKLTILSGIYQGEQLKLLPKETLILGSNPDRSQLIFNSTEVSDRHCQIQYDKECHTYQVTDYSQNGTYLDDGERLPKNREVRLEKGSIIQLGYSDNFIQLD